MEILVCSSRAVSTVPLSPVQECHHEAGTAHYYQLPEMRQADRHAIALFPRTSPAWKQCRQALRINQPGLQELLPLLQPAPPPHRAAVYLLLHIGHLLHSFHSAWERIQLDEEIL